MVPDRTRQLADRLIGALIKRGWTVVTAESCTGGLIAAALTEIPGSSAAVYGGFVTYANAAKSRMIGVPPELIEAHGAVSSEVALAMAEGARASAGVDLAIAVTGIAGPDGGSAEKPVGLVHFACATGIGTRLMERRFGDIGRQQVRVAAADAALELALTCLPD